MVEWGAEAVAQHKIDKMKNSKASNSVNVALTLQGYTGNINVLAAIFSSF